MEEGASTSTFHLRDHAHLDSNGNSSNDNSSGYMAQIQELELPLLPLPLRDQRWVVVNNKPAAQLARIHHTPWVLEPKVALAFIPHFLSSLRCRSLIFWCDVIIKEIVHRYVVALTGRVSKTGIHPV